MDVRCDARGSARHRKRGSRRHFSPIDNAVNEIVGYSADETLGRNLDVVIPPVLRRAEGSSHRIAQATFELTLGKSGVDDSVGHPFNLAASAVQNAKFPKAEGVSRVNG
jgi:hypothetical protein